MIPAADFDRYMMQHATLRAPARHLLAAVSSLSLISFSNAQQTLVVSGTGPFMTITAAVAAATAGDTVLVQSGLYLETLDIDKGIRLVGRGATLRSFFPILVHDLPAGETFTMIGFGTVGTPGAGNNQVHIVDCDGTIALRDLTQNGLHRWLINTTDVAQLHVSGCALGPTRVTDSVTVFENCVFDTPLVSGLTVDGGRTAAVKCTVNGGSNFPGPGIQLFRGDLALTRTNVFATGINAAIRTMDGTILVDPSTQLVPTGGQPAIVGPAGSAVFPFASIAASTNGQTLTMEAHGPANAAFATLLTLPRPETATPFGLAWIDSSNFGIVLHGAFPATNLHTSTLPHPALPPGFTVAMQVAYLTPTGVALSTPALVAVP